MKTKKTTRKLVIRRARGMGAKTGIRAGTSHIQQDTQTK